MISYFNENVLVGGIQKAGLYNKLQGSFMMYITQITMLLHIPAGLIRITDSCDKLKDQSRLQSERRISSPKWII